MCFGCFTSFSPDSTFQDVCRYRLVLFCCGHVSTVVTHIIQVCNTDTAIRASEIILKDVSKITQYLTTLKQTDILRATLLGCIIAGGIYFM